MFGRLSVQKFVFAIDLKNFFDVSRHWIGWNFFDDLVNPETAWKKFFFTFLEP